ncbi:MAG: UDP-N-acetylmuramoyl-tripeptide--D-alanyl-D-alanine ligase [Nitrospirales bacterium]|nr:UDP-N-acetylmuramoyl-tripeptide--D-alanyl-D-alanine ligase [Nitrospira sp.]MDR4500469.1 UDP-N-acetylmuramoyl-tripeptide--D-alanyl-D-alanine ligase [Nitrospirales bacterium]
MASFTMEEILQATGGQLLWAPSRVRVRRVSTDSRQVRKGDLFVALTGPNFDGHHFVKHAFRDGAVGAVISQASWSTVSPWIRRYRPRDTSVRPFIIGVDDPLVGFQEIASLHRRRFSIPLVSVTGSNGKTTAKEMVAHVLATKWRALKTQGNFNNSIGVPHTLLRMTHGYEVAVIEMGVDQEGQTTRLCEIAQPTIGVITNVGPDHLEFFGTIDASARAKAELLPALPSHGIAVLNADDAYFKQFARKAKCRVLSYGFSSHAQVRASDVDTDRRGSCFRLHLPERTRSIQVQLRVPGQHNISNALAGAAVGHALGVSGADIARGLSKTRPASMRSEIYRVQGVTYLYDCYNANPASMKAAIDLLMELSQGQRSIAVLGEMRELGKGESAFHREIGRYAARKNISCLLTCGPLGKELAAGARRNGMPASSVFALDEVIDAARTLKRLVRPRDVVLLKASRGVQLENVLDFMDSSRTRGDGVVST